MHELSLSEGIVNLVTECALREGIGRVSRVTVDIGAASAVDPDALLFCFPITAEGTVASGADLVINRIAMRARCTDCLTDYTPATQIDSCPACGSHARVLLAGREMRVASFEGE